MLAEEREAKRPADAKISLVQSKFRFNSAIRLLDGAGMVPTLWYRLAGTDLIAFT